MDTSGWRDQFLTETRQNIVKHILTALKKHSFTKDADGSHDLQKIAQSIESKAYAGATSRDDYLHKLVLKWIALKNASDWKTQLPHGFRNEMLAKMVENLIRTFNITGEERIVQTWRIVQVYEDMTFSKATSKANYLNIISSKFIQLETAKRSQQHKGQIPNQSTTHNEHVNSVGKDSRPIDGNVSADTKERKQSTRIKRKPNWTHDYHMG